MFSPIAPIITAGSKTTRDAGIIPRSWKAAGICDEDGLPLKSALLEIAHTGKANFRFTGNQNLILADIRKKDKVLINEILERYGIIQHTDAATAIRRNSIACVALPTCPLALAEAQRYLPSLITRIEGLLAGHGLEKEAIIIRMTGCPNGCGRPMPRRSVSSGPQRATITSISAEITRENG